MPMHSKTQFVAATANRTFTDDAELVVSIYGPRGGTKAKFGLSPSEARHLAQQLLDGADFILGAS